METESVSVGTDSTDPKHSLATPLPSPYVQTLPVYSILDEDRSAAPAALALFVDLFNPGQAKSISHQGTAITLAVPDISLFLFLS